MTKTTNKDSWNPELYQKFASARNQPFYDLLKLIPLEKGKSIVDLGCGTGELTLELHKAKEAKHTLGIDSSESMLKKAPSHPGLTFQHLKIEDFNPSKKYDLIFSNAALQWVPDHPHLFKRLVQFLAPQGQLAVQMPSNYDYITHSVAKEIASSEPFKNLLPKALGHGALKIEDYSQLLYTLGFQKQHVSAQVYPHLLDSTESIIEWVQGTLLTYYQSHLSPEDYSRFFTLYKDKVLKTLGPQKPFFMTFKRILLWAQK